jgi:hypothetical protein
MRRVLTQAEADLIRSSETLMGQAQAAMRDTANLYRTLAVTEGVAMAPGAYRAVYQRMASVLRVEGAFNGKYAFTTMLLVRVPATATTVVGHDGKPVVIGKVAHGYEWGAIGGNLIRDLPDPARSHHAATATPEARNRANFLAIPKLRRLYNIGLPQFPPKTREGHWLEATMSRSENVLVDHFTTRMNTAIGEVSSGAAA